jgi:hypothetical protein
MDSFMEEGGLTRRQGCPYYNASWLFIELVLSEEFLSGLSLLPKMGCRVFYGESSMLLGVIWSVRVLVYISAMGEAGGLVRRGSWSEWEYFRVGELAWESNCWAVLNFFEDSHMPIGLFIYDYNGMGVR